MLRLFKQTKWQAKKVLLLSGSFENVRIEISNFPYLENESTNKRKFIYKDFGVDFLNELHNQLGDFNTTYMILSSGGLIQLLISLKNINSVLVKITGQIDDNERKFDTDIADALLNAFKTEGIAR